MVTNVECFDGPRGSARPLNLPLLLCLALAPACAPDEAAEPGQPRAHVGGAVDTGSAAEDLPEDTSSPPPGGSAPTADAWTAANTRVERSIRGVATLIDVQTGRHPDFDRVVFEFRNHVPGYRLEYVDKPVRQCGSGDAVELAGDGWLEVTLEPAAAHTEAGEATVRERERSLELPVLRELELTCDFEAQVQWVLGVASPNRYQVLELEAPPRLVVDVRH